MIQMNTYQIQLRGQVDVEELNRMCPQKMTCIQSSPVTTCLSIYTDQSGLIGQLRHLHGLGFVILSVHEE